MISEADLYQTLQEGGLPARRMLDALEKYESERSLIHFFELCWPWFDPAPLEINWHHEAISEHLTAVSHGQIRRLLINIPPRSGKTSLASIVWPAWAWIQGKRTPLMGPQVRFLCVCYAASLSVEIATTARRLILCEGFQRLWGDRVKLLDDEASRARFATTAGGYRIAASIEGGTLGRGGDVKVIDDPHKINDVESDLERLSVIRSYDEALATRVIDPRTTAEVVIMQRLHEDDLSGHILTESIGDWDHLMIPMSYDPQRYVETSIGWSDPRRDMGEGALLWPTRFDDDWVDREQRRMGSVAWSGQMQQAPIGRGTEIIKPEWWQLWEKEEFPEYGTCVAALDTAYKEKESADYNALTVWAGFEHPETLKPKLMLRDAWQKRLNLADLVKAVIETCRKHKVERLLIEDASRGIDVQSEIWRLIGHREFRVQLVPVRGDKVARLNACVPVFENGVVYAPDRDWAQMVIDQVASFPRGRHDDLCFVAGTLIATRKGNIRIEFLKTNDEVLTPIGWCLIKAVNCTGWREVVTRNGLTGTLGHPIFTRDAGFVALDSVAMASQLVRLTLCDLIRMILPKSWSLWVHSTGSWAGSDGITSLNRPRTQDGKTLKVSMWPSGNMSPARKCLRATRCITETTIRSISMLIIWSAYQRIFIVDILKTMIATNSLRIWTAFADWRQRGTKALRVALGIKDTSQKVWTNIGMLRSEYEGKWRVSGAARFLVLRHRVAGFAPNHVPLNIPVGPEASAEASTPTLRPVYNLTVEGACGYFANGILVHNCDSTALSIMYLRETGVAVRREEHDLAFTDSRMYRKPARPLYDV